MSTITLLDTDPRSMSIEFQHRRPLSREMDLAALVVANGDPETLINKRLDLGLGKAVWVTPADKRGQVAYRQCAKHVIVTAVGTKDIVIYLIEDVNLGWYYAVVCDGAELELYVRSRYGYTAEGKRQSLGFDTLYCDLDGEYAGAVVAGYDLVVSADAGFTSVLQRPRFINEDVGATELPEEIVQQIDAEFMEDIDATLRAMQVAKPASHEAANVEVA